MKCPIASDQNVNTVTSADNTKCIWKCKQHCLKQKPTHKYYYQVQGELVISGMLSCVFVVRTEGRLFTDKIPFDVDLWQSVMLPKFIQYQLLVLLPYLCGGQVYVVISIIV